MPEVLFETFGRRVIGLHITRYGDGSNAEWRQVKGGHLPVYTVGRTYLFELLHSEMRWGRVKGSDSPMMRRAFAQLVNLQTEFRATGVVYPCPCQAIPMRLFSAPLLGQALGASLLLVG